MKKYNYFKTEKGVNEALYGRNNKDHGLYDYIISNAGISSNDTKEDILKKISNGIGVGFDGVSFIFVRFAVAHIVKKINTEKLNIPIDIELPIVFDYEKKDFSSGLKRLALLLKQQDKIALNKRNLISVMNPKNLFVQKSIKIIYDELNYNLNNKKACGRVRTLYDEWDRVFGKMYGDDDEATSFTEVSSVIKDLYGYSDTVSIDSKIYLFALQTFFNLFFPCATCQPNVYVE